MNSVRLLIIGFAISVILFASSSRVEAACPEGSTPAYFNLEVATFPNPCTLYFGGPDPLVQVNVVVNAVPFQKARFSLPNPPWGIVIEESWNYPFTGDRTTGMEFDRGDCSPGGPVVLGHLLVFVTPGTMGPCTSWKVDDGCEIDDCDGLTRAAVAWSYLASTMQIDCGCCFQCCQGLPPYDLNPPDGATDVALDAVLSWTGTELVNPIPPEACRVRIGTDPNCETGQTFDVNCQLAAFAPDFLQPGTTYYWQVTWSAYTGGGCSSGANGESRTQSFTTAGPLSATPATWGRVKALYRD